MKQMIIAVLVTLVIISGCMKSPDFDQLSYEFTVSTSVDKEADFAIYKTYFLSDTVRYIGNVGSDSFLVGAPAAELTGAVREDMAARGYSPVGRNANPDLGLILTAVKDINVVIDYYPGWWDPWYGGCYWYYYCWGYYYPWSTVYTYTTGTVMLNMYDLKNAGADHQIRALWNITALGALGSTATQNIQLGVTALHQGFEQSPYVKTN